MLNTQQYVEMRNGAFKNDGGSPTISNAPDLLLWDTTEVYRLAESTDWKYLWKWNNISGSLTGGNSSFSISAFRYVSKETTVFSGDFSNNKASAHVNINNQSLNKKTQN